MNEKTSAAPGETSVLFLRIEEFARRKAAEKTQIKDKLDALLADIAGSLPAADRIVLDAPDGNAIVVLESPAAALQMAERALAACAWLPICIGINHGPVQAAPGDRGAAATAALIGDGLQAAITAAGFATPGRLLATRAFREALKAGAPQRAQALVADGVYTDDNVRSHEMFAYDAKAAHRHRRRLLAWGVLGVCVILAAGYGGRLLRHGAMTGPRPAMLVFDIRPAGEVYIDGVARGRSPPLTRVELKPGAHRVEVRAGPMPPLQRELILEPGETATIAFRFMLPQRPPGFGDKQQPGVGDKQRREPGGDK